MTLQYDFFSDYWLGMVVYLLIALFNIAVVAIVIYLNIKSRKRDNDTESSQEEHPRWKRFATIAVVCAATIQSIYLGISSFSEIAFFSLNCAQGNYRELHGTVEYVELEYQDEDLYDIHFQVGDLELYDLYNDFLPKDISCIQEGQQICIQYGYINNELAIYRIYTLRGVGTAPEETSKKVQFISK